MYQRRGNIEGTMAKVEQYPYLLKSRYEWILEGREVALHDLYVIIIFKDEQYVSLES